MHAKELRGQNPACNAPQRTSFNLDKEKPPTTPCLPGHLHEQIKMSSFESRVKNLQEKGLLLKHDSLKPPHEVLAFRTESLSILIHHVGEPENQQ